MNAIHEFALLIAVVLPVAVLVMANMALFLGGERETLLLPGMRDYPAMDLAAMDVAVVQAPARSAPAPDKSLDFRLAA